MLRLRLHLRLLQLLLQQLLLRLLLLRLSRVLLRLGLRLLRLQLKRVQLLHLLLQLLLQLLLLRLHVLLELLLQQLLLLLPLLCLVGLLQHLLLQHLLLLLGRHPVACHLMLPHLRSVRRPAACVWRSSHESHAWGLTAVGCAHGAHGSRHSVGEPTIAASLVSIILTSGTATVRLGEVGCARRGEDDRR